MREDPTLWCNERRDWLKVHCRSPAVSSADQGYPQSGQGGIQRGGENSEKLLQRSKCIVVVLGQWSKYGREGGREGNQRHVAIMRKGQNDMWPSIFIKLQQQDHQCMKLIGSALLEIRDHHVRSVFTFLCSRPTLHKIHFQLIEFLWPIAAISTCSLPTTSCPLPLLHETSLDPPPFPINGRRTD